MACLIRLKEESKPIDTFLNNDEKKALAFFIVDTNEEKTRIVLINKQYSRIEVRINGKFENFFENRIILEKESDLSIIYFDTQNILFEIWHAPNQATLDFLIKYLDSGPGDIVK